MIIEKGCHVGEGVIRGVAHSPSRVCVVAMITAFLSSSIGTH